MLNFGKIKYRGRRIFCFSSLSSSLQNPSYRISPSPSNASNLNSESSNQRSFLARNLQNIFPPENINSAGNLSSVTAFFKNHDFSDTQISTIIKKWPSVFNHTPESSFRPKIVFFRSLGLSSSEIVKILTKAPYLLEKSLQNEIVPVVYFLQSYLRSDKNVILCILKCPFILGANLQDTLLHNVGILKFAGVRESSIVTLLKSSPSKIGLNPKRFKSMVVELQKVGIRPHTRNFIEGIRPHTRNFIEGIMVMGQLSGSTWDEKISSYKRYGWTEFEILDAFKKHPRFMSASVDKITRALDLLVDRMGCELSGLIHDPQIMTLDFERILVPRCAFYQVLLCKGLIEKHSLLGLMVCLRSFSIEDFVIDHAEGDHQLLKVYITKFLASRKNGSLEQSSLE